MYYSYNNQIIHASSVSGIYSPLTQTSVVVLLFKDDCAYYNNISAEFFMREESFYLKVFFYSFFLELKKGNVANQREHLVLLLAAEF